MTSQTPDFSVGAYLLPSINREGRSFAVIALAIAVVDAVLAGLLSGFVSALLGALFIPLLLVSYGVYLFFRDPERVPPDDDPKAILSPADGRVCLIGKVPLPEELRGEGEGADQLYWRVCVFMSVFNVHVNRMPFAGTVLKKVHTEGKFLNASLEKASEENERCAYLMETADGVRYGVVQVAGLVAKRIVPFVKEGDVVGRAERFGLIRFGSRLDVYLPVGVKCEARIGQIMVAGETVLGHMA